jgi:hypothetical protein
MNGRNASGTLPLALSVRMPWAAAIFWADPLKNCENRGRATTYRGRLYIHVAASVRSNPGWERSPMGAVLAAIPAERLDLHGLIIGTVQLDGCVRDSTSPWAIPGSWHWLLADPVPLAEPVPATGQRGLWTPPEGLRLS